MSRNILKVLVYEALSYLFPLDLREGVDDVELAVFSAVCVCVCVHVCVCACVCVFPQFVALLRLSL